MQSTDAENGIATHAPGSAARQDRLAQAMDHSPKCNSDRAVYVELMINTECSARAAMRRLGQTLEGRDDG